MPTIPLPKSFVRALRVFISLFVLAVLGVIFINLPIFDEDLNPELVSGAVAIEMPAAQENAYIALWGIGAAAEFDMIDTGLAMIARHNENVASFGRHDFNVEDYEEVLGLASSPESISITSLDASWLESYEHCLARSRLGCLNELSRNVVQIQSNERFNTILSRYKEIVQMPFFTEPYYDSAFDSVAAYQLLMESSFLHLTLEYGSNSQEFLQQVEQDMIFWKMVLEDKNSLIAKMVAVASIWKNARFVSEYISEQELSSSDIQLIERILVPLTEDQSNITEAWWSEIFPTIQAVNDESWTIKMFAQPNATNNLFWLYLWKPILEMSELSASELYTLVQTTDVAGKSALDCCRPDVNDFFTLSPASFYNLSGKYAMSSWLVPSWNPVDYMQRVHDLNGVLRLFQLKLEIAVSSPQNILSMIEQSGITNPHTGETIEYDPEQGLIYFECQDSSSLCGVEIKTLRRTFQ